MTEQELLDALARAQDYMDEDNDAMTAGEISELTGVGIKTVRKRLKKLIKGGHVTPVWVIRDTIMTPLNGRMARVPGYRFLDHGTPVSGEGA